MPTSVEEQNPTFEEEASSHTLGSWDQFAANKSLAKGPSTYDELIYTTALPNDIPQDWEKRTDEILRSMKTATQDSTPDLGHANELSSERTEEEIHCSVRRDDEPSPFHFEGTHSNSPSQLQTSNRAVKERCLRRTRRMEGAVDTENAMMFPDLTPTELDFTITTKRKGRRKKKRIKRTATTCTDGTNSSSPEGDEHEDSVTPEPTQNGKQKRRRDIAKSFSNYFPTTGHRTDKTPSGKSKLPPSLAAFRSTPQDSLKTCPVKGCVWKTLAHGGRWQAYYNHVATRHANEVPESWWTNEGRFLCQKCGRHYEEGKRATHDNACKGTSTDSVANPANNLTQSSLDHGSRSTDVSQSVQPLPLPSLSDICMTPINTSRDVPFRCRYQWAKTLTDVLSSVASENSVAAWTRLGMLPKCVLPAPNRGGRKGRLSYASHVTKSLERWGKVEFTALWIEATKNNTKSSHPSTKDQDQDQELAQEVRRAKERCEKLVRQGEVSRGMSALTAAPFAPDNDETYCKLMAKHPTRAQDCMLQDLPYPNAPPLKVNEEEVKHALGSFRKGSSGGTMSLRAEHLQIALRAHVDEKVHPLTALTDVVNVLLSGKAPFEIQERFAGARLCALQKGECDVRPIAAGETIRRLVGKVACLTAKKKASRLFKGIQYGVATPAGSERVIHLCRQTMSRHADDTNFVLCKVDLANAFNRVSRSAFIALLRKHFPELSAWVEWTYSTDSLLTYGSRTLPSSEGVQQGDPLGPLLFSLVMLEAAKMIKEALPGSLQLHLWYLDDGVIAGKAEDVSFALETLSRVGPKWGLHINTSKCEIITNPASAHQTALFSDIPEPKINREGNFDILGSPIGSAQHCIDFLTTHAVEPAEETLEAIEMLEDPQIALSLIRQCAGFCQMVHSLRTTPPHELSALCQRLDEAVLHAYEWNICPLSSSARSQVQRPKRYGGFGLRSASAHRSAAYVSSVAFAAETDRWLPSDAEGFSSAVLDINRRSGGPVVDPGHGKSIRGDQLPFSDRI